MSRKKLSEYRSKQLIYDTLGEEYIGWSILGMKDVDVVKGYRSYVVKVDQAVKGRFKKGLVLLDVSPSGVRSAAKKLFAKGYESLLVEPHFDHDQKQERFLSLSRTREGLVLSYSKRGGVDIEKYAETIKSTLVDDNNLIVVCKEMGIKVDQFLKIKGLIESAHISFLEINPYVVVEGSLRCLDIAIEVDSTAELLVDVWSEQDIRSTSRRLTDEEIVVQKLNKDSVASFNLEVMNRNGSIFLLLSGGGASVVIADEIFNLGSGGALANYGEYSGNPSEHETYLYTQQIMSLILKSNAKKKVLFIGGAVANFTNIATTFKGIIHVLEDNAEALQNQPIKVYVRRGGPHQAVGLNNIEITLKKLGIYGGVYDPIKSIPEAVQNLHEGIS